MVMSYGVKTRACLSIVSLNVRVPNRCSDISCFNADHRFWWDDNNTDFSMPDETWLFKSNIFLKSNRPQRFNWLYDSSPFSKTVISLFSLTCYQLIDFQSSLPNRFIQHFNPYLLNRCHSQNQTDFSKAIF